MTILHSNLENDTNCHSFIHTTLSVSQVAFATCGIHARKREWVRLTRRQPPHEGACAPETDPGSEWSQPDSAENCEKTFRAGPAYGAARSPDIWLASCNSSLAKSQSYQYPAPARPCSNPLLNWDSTNSRPWASSSSASLI